MATEPEPASNLERLALIQGLWNALADHHEDSEEYRALTARIRRETTAFLAALDAIDPTR